MSVRASFVAVAVALGIVFVVGCGQTSSPTSPSSFVSSPVSGSTSAVQSSGTFAPLLAQLNLVAKLLASANHQADLFDLEVPDRPVLEGRPPLDRTLDFYQRANAALDLFAPNYSPLVGGTDLLNLIIEQANFTLELITRLPPGPPPPSVPQIIKEAGHIILVATTLVNCQKAPCWPPVQ